MPVTGLHLPEASVPVMFGTSGNPANNVYGIAFTLNYDYTLIKPGSVSVDYTGSWIESAGNHLHLEKDFPAKLDVAFTRINHTDVSGYGKIATLTFTISDSIKGTFYFNFSKIKAISHNELDIPVQANEDSVYIDSQVNTTDLQANFTSIVYPNPMTNSATIYLNNPNHEIFYFTLTDLTGRHTISQMVISNNEETIERKNLRSGIYFYDLKNENSTKYSRGKIMIE